MRLSAFLTVLLLSVSVSPAGVPVTVDPATEHQIIDGFGANQPQYYYVTDYFSGKMLDLAFKRSGMGMSLLRCDMPLGFEGVESLGTGNDNSDPELLDWSGFDRTILDSLAAVAQGAAARGCERFIATPWSPPWWMKDNQSETGGGSLLPGMEEELAEYFRAFLTYLSGGTGDVDPPVHFDHVTVQNEPEQSPGWWGCVYSPAEVTGAMHAVGDMLAAHFPSVTMAAGDNATVSHTLNYLSTIMADPDVEPMVGILSVHPYAMPWTNPDHASSVISRWDNYYWQTLGYGRRSWMVEHCDAEYPDPDPARTGWTSGLNGATHLHRALVDGRVSAWAYWTLYRRDADQPNQGYGHSLWYSEAAEGNATLRATGKVPALTPFYRYVRPGYRRVAASPADASTDLRVTAFKAPGGVDEGLVIVVINRASAERDLDVVLTDSGSIGTLRRCEAAEYDSGGTIGPALRGRSPVTLSSSSFSASVPARSVTAFVHEAGSPWPTAQADIIATGLRVSADASTSSPPSIERHRWDFGDGSEEETAAAVHDYAQAGTYDIVLTVTETEGGIDTLTESVTVQGWSLAGNVLYYRDATGNEPGSAPVGGVTIDLQGTSVADSTLSDPVTGDYAFLDLPYQNITVDAAKAGDIAGISSYDASKVSQFRVGIDIPTPNQRIAADVSGNGEISSYDASLVSQMRVGIISRFPVAEQTGFDWAFAPASRSYDPLDSDRSGEGYLGILYGDVTGNWAPPTGGQDGKAPPRNEEPTLPSTGPCTLSLDGPYQVDSPGGGVGLRLRAEDCQGLFGLDVDLAYDPELLVIESVRTAEEDSPFTVVSHDRPGLCGIALYGAWPLQESADLLVIETRPVGRKVRGLPITVKWVQANEGQIAVELDPRISPRRNPSSR